MEQKTREFLERVKKGDIDKEKAGAQYLDLLIDWLRKKETNTNKQLALSKQYSD